MSRRFSLDRPHSAERPVSLHPLPFKDAIALLLQVRPTPADSGTAKERQAEQVDATKPAASRRRL